MVQGGLFAHAQGHVDLARWRTSRAFRIQVHMPYIWVTTDEWIIIDKSRGNGLVTSGLSGCVGVALVTQNRCLLSHVYSACTEQTWPQRPRLAGGRWQNAQSGSNHLRPISHVCDDYKCLSINIGQGQPSITRSGTFSKIL